MSPIYFDTEAVAQLQTFLQEIENQQRKLFILCDENTHVHCLPVLSKMVSLPFFVGLTVAAGENSKTIATASGLWERLLSENADKGSVLLCLGGGMISDLGGFSAAVFKRGMDCVFVPTSLMAQVDAAIGGKNALNFGGAKNQIGLFYLPKAVFLFPQFLQTLPEREIWSAYAEMLKHGLIADKDYWNELKNLQSASQIIDIKYIKKSVEIKTAICQQDEQEKHIRKKLNFGHTVGHALEAFFLSTDTPLSHGEAVAMGMVAEARISWQMGLLSEDELAEITDFLRGKFVFPQVNNTDYQSIVSLMNADKKRKGNRLNFTLLKEVGVAVVDKQVKEDFTLSNPS